MIIAFQEVQNATKQEQATLRSWLTKKKHPENGVELWKSKKASVLDSRACLRTDVETTASTVRKPFPVTSKNFRKEVHQMRCFEKFCHKSKTIC